VLQAKNEEEYRVSLDALDDLPELAGCAALTRHVTDKELIVRCLSHFLLLGRAAAAIDQ